MPLAYGTPIFQVFVADVATFCLRELRQHSSKHPMKKRAGFARIDGVCLVEIAIVKVAAVEAQSDAYI